MKTNNVPFKHALAMMQSIMLAQNLPEHLRHLAYAEIGQYRSRSQSRLSKPNRNWMRHAGRSKYQPHQGTQECARRVQQFNAKYGFLRKAA